jgi:hypothetical protein
MAKKKLMEVLQLHFLPINVTLRRTFGAKERHTSRSPEAWV